MKRLALIAVVWALVAAPAASAEPFTPEAEANYRAALAAWGVTSPPGCSSVDRQLVDGATLEALGRATIPAEPPEPCNLKIAKGMEPCLEYGVEVHEVGHLVGNDHNLNPASIMFDGDEPAGGGVRWWCEYDAATSGIYEDFQPIADRKRVWIDRWVARCSTSFNRNTQRRRECWDYPRTWRHDLRREWRMVADESAEAIAALGPPPTLP